MSEIQFNFLNHILLLVFFIIIITIIVIEYGSLIKGFI